VQARSAAAGQIMPFMPSVFLFSVAEEPSDAIANGLAPIRQVDPVGLRNLKNVQPGIGGPRRGSRILCSGDRLDFDRRAPVFVASAKTASANPAQFVSPAPVI